MKNAIRVHKHKVSIFVMFSIACTLIFMLVTQVSELAPDSLKRAASEEDNIIQLPSLPNANDQSGQINVVGYDGSKGKPMERLNHHLGNGVSADPLMEEMIDLISLDEPAPAATSLDSGIGPWANGSGEFEDNAFGEPDAFSGPLEGRPSEAVTIGETTESVDARYLDFSDSETWEDSDRPNRSTQSLSSLPQSSSGAFDSAGYELHGRDSTGVLQTGSVDWSQLMSGLSIPPEENGNFNNTSIEGSTPVGRIDDPASQMTANPDLENMSSPFAEPETTNFSDRSPMGMDLSMEKSPLKKTLSRVESLRVRSQQQLEEMFASNLRTFDITTSAAAHPGSIPWILPRHPVKNAQFPGMPRPRPMVENRPSP